MAKTASKLLIAFGIIGAVLALFWPVIEENFVTKGAGCPWPFSIIHSLYDSFAVVDQASIGADEALKSEENGGLRLSVEEMRKYNGDDPELPIYLGVNGKILDVSSGSRFYGKGSTYQLFSGRASTRALTIGSLKEEDINDDVSDFTEKQQVELADTIKFYTEKYPIVGEYYFN